MNGKNTPGSPRQRDASQPAQTGPGNSKARQDKLSSPRKPSRHENEPQERWLQERAPDRRVVYRSNSTTSLLSVAREGVGVALLPCYIGDADPGLRRIDGPAPAPQEIWLLVHGDLRRTPRVRAVIDWLDELVERARTALLGQR